MLGAVGAYDWNGTVVMHTPGGTIVPGKTQFYNPRAEAGYEGLAGYLGELVQMRGAEQRLTTAPIRPGCPGTQDSSHPAPEELLLQMKYCVITI